MRLCKFTRALHTGVTLFLPACSVFNWFFWFRGDLPLRTYFFICTYVSQSPFAYLFLIFNVYVYVYIVMSPISKQSRPGAMNYWGVSCNLSHRNIDIHVMRNMCTNSNNVLDCFEMSLTCPGINCRWANPNSHWSFWVVWNLSLKKTSSLKHFLVLKFELYPIWLWRPAREKPGRKGCKTSEARLRLIPRSQVRDKAVTKFTFCIWFTSWFLSRFLTAFSENSKTTNVFWTQKISLSFL